MATLPVTDATFDAEVRKSSVPVIVFAFYMILLSPPARTHLMAMVTSLGATILPNRGPYVGTFLGQSKLA